MGGFSQDASRGVPAQLDSRSSGEERKRLLRIWNKLWPEAIATSRKLTLALPVLTAFRPALSATDSPLPQVRVTFAVRRREPQYLEKRKTCVEEMLCVFLPRLRIHLDSARSETSAAR